MTRFQREWRWMVGLLATAAVVASVLVAWDRWTGSLTAQFFPGSSPSLDFPPLRQRHSISVDQMALRDLLARLQEESGVPILPDWANLSIAGDTPISLDVQETSLRTILDLVLLQLDAPVVIEQQAGNLWFTSKDVWYGRAGHYVTHMHPLTQLVGQREGRFQYDRGILGLHDILPDRDLNTGELRLHPGGLVVIRTASEQRMVASILEAVRNPQRGPQWVADGNDDELATARAALDHPVEGAYEKVPLEQILRDLCRQANVPLFIDADLPQRPMTLKLPRSSLGDVLEILLHYGVLTYSAIGNHLLVTSDRIATESIRVYPVEGLPAEELEELWNQLWPQLPGAAPEMLLDSLVIRESMRGHLRMERLLEGCRYPAKAPDFVVQSPRDSEARRKLLDVLSSPAELHLQDCSLSDLQRLLADKFGVAVFLDLESVRENGHVADTKLRDQFLRSDSLEGLLHGVLAELDLTIKLLGETVWITNSSEYTWSPNIVWYDPSGVDADADEFIDLIQSVCTAWELVPDAIAGASIPVDALRDDHERVRRLLKACCRAAEPGQGPQLVPGGVSFREMDEVMQRRVTWDFDKTPLRVVAAQLDGEGSVPFHCADERAPYWAGKFGDLPITYRCTDRPLGEALVELLGQHQLRLNLREDGCWLSDVTVGQPAYCCFPLDALLPSGGGAQADQMAMAVSGCVSTQSWSWQDFGVGAVYGLGNVLVVRHDLGGILAVSRFLKQLEEGMRRHSEDWTVFGPDHLQQPTVALLEALERRVTTFARDSTIGEVLADWSRQSGVAIRVYAPHRSFTAHVAAAHVPLGDALELLLAPHAELTYTLAGDEIRVVERIWQEPPLLRVYPIADLVQRQHEFELEHSAWRAGAALMGDYAGLQLGAVFGIEAFHWPRDVTGSSLFLGLHQSPAMPYRVGTHLLLPARPADQRRFRDHVQRVRDVLSDPEGAPMRPPSLAWPLVPLAKEQDAAAGGNSSPLREQIEQLASDHSMAIWLERGVIEGQPADWLTRPVPQTSSSSSVEQWLLSNLAHREATEVLGMTRGIRVALRETQPKPLRTVVWNVAPLPGLGEGGALTLSAVVGAVVDPYSWYGPPKTFFGGLTGSGGGRLNCTAHAMVVHQTDATLQKIDRLLPWLAEHPSWGPGLFQTGVNGDALMAPSTKTPQGRQLFDDLLSAARTADDPLIRNYFQFALSRFQPLPDSGVEYLIDQLHREARVPQPDRSAVFQALVAIAREPEGNRFNEAFSAIDALLAQQPAVETYAAHLVEAVLISGNDDLASLRARAKRWPQGVCRMVADHAGRSDSEAATRLLLAMYDRTDQGLIIEHLHNRWPDKEPARAWIDELQASESDAGKQQLEAIWDAWNDYNDMFLFGPSGNPNSGF